MISTDIVFDPPFDNLVMPTKIGIHVFARAIRVLRCTKKDVDADLRQHDGVIKDQCLGNMA